MTTTINQDMSIPEIVEKYPQTLPVFNQFGISPEGYKALVHENLFATARVHQLDLKALIDALNRVIAS